MTNSVECVGFGGECECGCYCCVGLPTDRCEPGTEHPVANDHSTSSCPQSKDVLYRTEMVHEG